MMYSPISTTTRQRPTGRHAAAAATLAAFLLSACGSIPVSSLWKLRNLNLETLDPAALRAAVVHHPSLQLDQDALQLTVSVSRTVRKPNGTTTTELLEEKLPLQVLRSTAERSALVDYDNPQQQTQVWRIDPAALPRLQALRARALALKGNDDGKRELGLGLGLELAGCQPADAPQHRRVTTLMRLTERGDYIPILRNMDLADAMPAAALAQRFPVCSKH